jgi:hypothetical protein
MNKLILATALAMTGAFALAAPAFAQTAKNTQSSTAPAAQPATATQPAAAAHPAGTAQIADAQHAKQRSVPPLNSRQCIRHTGSHIPPPRGQCLPVPGNSYTQQDILRTGEPDLGRALQMLDPSVHGH